MNCTSDDVCGPNLVCYDHHEKTDAKQNQVTGCSGNKLWRYGYCYTKDLNYVPPAIPHMENPPPADAFQITNNVGGPQECAVYAVDADKTILVPFDGSSSKYIRIYC